MNRRRATDGLRWARPTPTRSRTRASGRSIRSLTTIAPGTTPRTGGGRTCFALNYSYDVPNLSKKWDNIIARCCSTTGRSPGSRTCSDRHLRRPRLQLRQRADRHADRHRGDQRRRQPRGASSATRICRAATQTFERQFKTECITPPTDQYRLGTATSDEYLGQEYVELGHLVLQERSPGRLAAPAAPRSSCTTRSTRTSGPAGTRTRTSTTRRGD